MKKGLFIFYLFSFLFAYAQTEPVALPYSNSFESEADRNYWYSMSTGPGNPWIFSEEVSTIYGPSNGSFYARFQSTTQNPATAWLISKQITMEAGQNIALEFDYRSSLATNFPQKLEVLLKEIPAPGTENTTQLWANEAIQINVYQNAYLTFQVPVSGTYHIIFHAYSDANLGYISMDNVNLYIENCPKPQNVQVMPGQTTAEISWQTNEQPEDGYEYVVQLAGNGEPTGTGVAAEGTFVNAENLLPEANYEVYVRSVCESGAVYSNWSAPKTFTTYPAPTVMPVNLPYHESFEQEGQWQMLPPAQGEPWQRENSNIGTLYGPSDGEYYLRHYDSSNTSSAWTFSRGINLQAGQEITLEFDYKSSQDTAYPQKMKVVINKDGFPSSNSVDIWENDFIQSTTYQTETIMFTVPEDGVYYLGYYAFSEPNFGYLMFDNVKVYTEGISPCEYVLRLKDEMGDGWNNNTMDLLVNGDTIFNDITLQVGEYMDFPFQISSNDAITAVWNGGSHSGWQTSYEIYDSEGNLVGSASEADITTPIYASCPDCAKPSDVFAHNGQTTVDITWEFLTQPAFGYEYVVQPIGQGEPTSAGIPSEETQAHVDGLTPETDYEIYVRSVCEQGVEFSSWAGPVNFRTLPYAGTAVDLPYNYDFEQEDGWISQSISLNNQWVISNLDPAQGQTHAAHNYNYYFDANAWLFSRGLNLQAGQEILIKFQYKAMGLDIPFSFSIAQNAYGFAQQSEIIWSQTISNADYTQAIISFTPETSGVYYLGFNSLATKGNSVFLDDVQVYTVGLPDAPECEYLCPDDFTVEANHGDMGAVVDYDLDFDCEGSSTGVVSVLAQGLPSGAIFPVGETTVTHNLIFNGEIIGTCSFVVTVDEGDLGTGDLEQSQFSFYPNPVKDKLNINMDKNIENVDVYSLTGQLVKSENWNTKSGTIELTGLPQGIYIVNLKTSSNVKSFKVVKK